MSGVVLTKFNVTVGGSINSNKSCLEIGMDPNFRDFRGMSL